MQSPYLQGEKARSCQNNNCTLPHIHAFLPVLAESLQQTAYTAPKHCSYCLPSGTR